MKKNFTFLLLIAMALIIHSCSPKAMPRVVLPFYTDYSKYSKDGFLISPNPYPEKFTSLGEISIVVFPGDVIEKKINRYESNNNTYSTSIITGKEYITNEELTDIAVNFVKERGGNAIVNFKCEIVNFSYYFAAMNKPQKEVYYYVISGFAIKI